MTDPTTPAQVDLDELERAATEAASNQEQVRW